MSIVESAIQNFFDHNDEFSIDTVKKHFDYSGRKIDNRLLIEKLFRFNFRRKALIIPYKIKFPRMAQDQAEIVKIFKEWEKENASIRDNR
jgi:hypothetical protein